MEGLPDIGSNPNCDESRIVWMGPETHQLQFGEFLRGLSTNRLKVYRVSPAQMASHFFWKNLARICGEQKSQNAYWCTCV